MAPRRIPLSRTARRLALALPPARAALDERDALRRQLDQTLTQLSLQTAQVASLEVAEEAARRAASPLNPDLRFLVICTYGRTGSTLLQGLLNAAPGVIMRGENHDALRSLHRYHQVVMKARAEHTPESGALAPTSAWYGIDGYQPELAVTLLRLVALQTLLRPDPDTQLVGYKEIRWQHAEDQWRDYLDFIQVLLPGVKFIVLTRDNDAVARSSWWATAGSPRTEVEKHAARRAAIGEYLGDVAYPLHYDDFIADPEVLRGLYDWLGIEFDRATVDQVMAVRHSH